MVKFLEKKGGKLSLMDALLIAGTKTLSEQVLARTPVGNSTYLSGAVKIAGAIVSTNVVGGKVGDILGTALMVDGAEDVAHKFLGTTFKTLVSGNSANSGERPTI